MAKKYVLKLTAEERAELARLVRKGNAAGWKLQRAQALLKCDQGPDGPAWPDARIAEAFGVTTRSLESGASGPSIDGPMALLQRKPRTPSGIPKLGGETRGPADGPGLLAAARGAWRGGRCGCWPSGWSSWRSSSRSRTRPSAALSKKAN